MACHMGHSAGEDLVLLGSCDHTVITTETFGRWAAWSVEDLRQTMNIMITGPF